MKLGAWLAVHNSIEPPLARAVALRGSSPKCCDGAT